MRKMRKLGKSQRRESENIIGKTFDSDGTGKKIMKTKREGLQKKISSGGKSSFCQRKL